MPEYGFSITRIVQCKDKNCRFCPYMGKDESEKTRTLYAVIGLFETFFFFTGRLVGVLKFYGQEIISETCLLVTGNKPNAHKKFRR